MHEGAGNGDSMGSFKTRVQMAHAGDMERAGSPQSIRSMAGGLVGSGSSPGLA